MIKAIVAVDLNWGIGKNNGLLFHVPADMKFFRETTIGNVVVMGSNTLKSLPGGRPLPDRVNIVLWPGGENRGDCLIAEDIPQLKRLMYPHKDRDIFVVGGAMFYRTMLPYCKEALVTKVEADGDAEVFFPNLDVLSDWKIASMGDPFESGGHTIKFVRYENTAPADFFADINLK